MEVQRPLVYAINPKEPSMDWDGFNSFFLLVKIWLVISIPAVIGLVAILVHSAINHACPL